MGTAAFEKNALVTLDGKEHRLHRLIATLWQLEEVKTGRFLELEQDQLMRKYVDRSLIFTRKSSVTHCGPTIYTLSPQDDEVAKVRLAYVRETLEVPNTRSRLAPVIAEVWDKIKFPKKAPGYTTVYLWKCRYLESNNDYRALVDRTNGKGNRSRRYPSEVLEICRQSIETKFLRRERNTIQRTTDDALFRVKQANNERIDAMKLRLPTRRLVSRLIKQIPAQEKYSARYGAEAARKMYRSVKGHVVTHAPLERAEIDHTQLDLIVVDDKTSKPIGRPYVTACIDDYSRCILGIYVGFIPPSYNSVQRCLRDCFQPKLTLKDEYPEIKSAWPAYGLMRDLIVDGGLEFHGTSLEQMCNSLGVTIVASSRRTPWDKGKIERFLGTLNRAVTEGVSGTTFRNIAEKGDYDASKNAVVTMTTLKKIIRCWIADSYHQQVHSTIHSTPASMWASGITPQDIRLPEDLTEFDAVMGSTKWCSLTHKGIEFKGLFYNSADLNEIRCIEGNKIRVQIRVDEDDMGSIYVLWPKSSKILKVPASRPDYANGLSLWQHKINKKCLRDRADIYQNADDLLQVQQDISRWVDEDSSLKRKRMSKRVGRYNEHSERAAAKGARAKSAAIQTESLGRGPVAPSESKKPVLDIVRFDNSAIPSVRIATASRPKLKPMYREGYQRD